MFDKEHKNKKDKSEEQEDIDFTTDDNYSDDGENGTNHEIKERIAKLKKEIEKLQKEKQTYLDSLQRAKADFINMRRRDEEEKESYLKSAKADLILEILPVIDSFESAFNHREKWDELPEVWRKGIENIHSKFISILSKEGVSEINPENEKFNPEKHTAIAIEETDKEDEDDIIAEVVEKGYSLNGKIIRAPKVKIKQYKN